MLSNEEIRNLLMVEIATNNPYTGTNAFNLDRDEQKAIMKLYKDGERSPEALFSSIKNENTRVKIMDLFSAIQ